MPDWLPIWDDVQFNHVAAQQYATTCEQTATLLSNTNQERQALAAQAVIEWEGPNRERFDREMHAWANASDALVQRLGAIAAKVRDASARARQLQTQREADRLRWFAEDALEREAARLAAEQQSVA